MPLNQFSLPKVFVFSLFLFLSFSCSKDSDLLSEYVINDLDSSLEIRRFVTDDFYLLAPGDEVTLDVLENDQFEEGDTVQITETSEPENGQVTINEDNTVTYEPDPVETELTETSDNSDTFTYTTEIVDDEGTVSTETASVTLGNRFPDSGSNIFYVRAGGNSSNDGKTEASAWDIAHAFKVARPGDIIHIKAGLYSDYNIVQNTNGTDQNPIRFVGYRNEPNDINPDEQVDYTLGTQTIKVLSSYSHGDQPDQNGMPLLREARNGSKGSGVGVRINGSNVHLYNTQIQYYSTGMWVSGNNCVFKNIITEENGDFGSSAYDGNGIQNRGNRNTWKNIYVGDAGAQGFTIRGSNGLYDAITVAVENTTNPMDYYFLFQESNNNVATNIHVKRVGNISHYGHGINFKSREPCFNNLVDGFIVDNTQLEAYWPGVHDNEVKNGYIYKPAQYSTVIGIGARIHSGSYNNTYSNIFLENCMISFMGWEEGGFSGDSSDGNVFNQITVKAGQSAVAFNYFESPHFSFSADNNTFYNCTFYDTDFWFERSRANSNTRFINCIFAEIDGNTFYSIKAGSPGFAVDASYSNCNFYSNGFSPPTGNNITVEDPQFVSPGNNNFALGSSSSLNGRGIETPFLNVGNNIGSFQN